MHFKQGDIVRLKKEHESHRRSFAAVDLEVTSVVDDDMVRVRKAHLQDGTRESFFGHRLVLVKAQRDEGRTIKHKDIKVGDEILNAFQSGDLTLTRQGVVASIGGVHGGYALWTADHKRIDVDPDRETYTLVKAVEEDKVLKALTEAKAGSVVEFHLPSASYARKSMFGVWDVYKFVGVSAKSSKELAEMIRSQFGTETFRWLSNGA